MDIPFAQAAHPSDTGETPDPLAAMISLLRPETVLSKVVSGAGDWSIRYARYEDPAFCIVLEGSCFLDADGIDVVELQKGDFIFFLETPAFALAHDLEIEPTLVAPKHSQEVHHGSASDPVTTRMLGGYFRVDRANVQLLGKLLPTMILIRREEASAGRLRQVVELIAEEAVAERPGRGLILERLVQVLLVEALRSRPTSPEPQERGLLAGLSDPALARSLQKIHGDVARRWTVADLARTAHMSRAVFAERFAQTVGMPPIQYLLEWRMALAKDMLRRERPHLGSVAERIGYQSASAFSTAFSRLTGISPSAFARAGS